VGASLLSYQRLLTRAIAGVPGVHALFSKPRRTFRIKLASTAGFKCAFCVFSAYPTTSVLPFGGRGPGVRVGRIAAGFLDRLRRCLTLTPTLSQRGREFWDIGSEIYTLPFCSFAATCMYCAPFSYSKCTWALDSLPVLRGPSIPPLPAVFWRVTASKVAQPQLAYERIDTTEHCISNISVSAIHQISSVS